MKRLLATPQSRKRTAEAQRDALSLDEINELSNRVIGCAINVHRVLGPGFIERIYGKAFAHELEKHDIAFRREHAVQIAYDGVLLGEQRLDFVVEEEIVLEVKAMYEINNFHLAQVLSYLKATNLRLGLILNFARPRLQIKRVAYRL